MNKNLRTQCIISESELHHVFTFKNFPIIMNCVEGGSKDTDQFKDMKWGCSNIGHIQLIELLDPALIYKEYHNPGTIGKIWNKHHHTFYNFIKQYNDQNLLEIGGGAGALAKLFLQDDRQFNWTIIEPFVNSVINDPRIHYVEGFFDEYLFKDTFDAVVHSHVLEHVYDPMTFLNKINTLLKEGSNHFITFPNMKHWLEQGYSNTLMFEHTYYVDEHVLEYVLAKNGFEIKDKIIEDHSIFLKCVKTNNVQIPDTNFDYVKELFNNYVSKLLDDVSQIKEKISDRNIYIFGAHIFSQMLINLGIPEDQILNILDNDSKKQGKRMYGTNLIVASPECLKEQDSPAVIVRAGAYSSEIKETLLTINPTVKFY